MYTPDFMRGNTAVVETKKKSEPTKFREMSLDKFRAVVNNAATSNEAASYDAICKADIRSFWVANPYLKQTPANIKLVNHWLVSRGITHPLYPDFQAATDALTQDGLLSVDQIEHVQWLDGKRPSKYRDPITGVMHDSLDSLIVNSRNDAQNAVPQQSKEAIDFDELPLEEVQALCKAAIDAEEAAQNAPQTQINADAFLTNHGEVIDNERNAKMISMQRKANGVNGVVTQAQLERATNQLRESGLLSLNNKALDRQRAAEVQRLADKHVIENPSEEEMYSLDMDTLRARADQALLSR